MTAVAGEALIPTLWVAGAAGRGMSTCFELDGSWWAAPSVSDWARKSLTEKEARWLVANGKAIRTEAPSP